MSSLIEHIEIKNFKSIRHLKMDGFKKINLFIGKPNVGKSNILEALSVFTIPYLKDNSQKKLTNLIRLEEPTQIFNDGNFEKEAVIDLVLSNARKLKSQITFNKEKNVIRISLQMEENHDYNPVNTDFLFNGISLKQFGSVSSGKSLEFESIKRYTFNIDSKPHGKNKLPFLVPPFGPNLMYVLELLPKLRDQYAQWFKQYGLRLVLDKSSTSIKIMKDNGDEVFLLPYSLIADTLQRIIFYKTAVSSNDNSVLIFEEPEAHSFPPYIAEFTQEVIRSETNQFFIATHSPIIVDDFLENAIEDLAIYMVNFNNGQTIVRTLSKKEIDDVYKYGIDLFFNNESYFTS